MDLNICKLCNNLMKIRESEYGIFFGCSKYPKCKNKLTYDFVLREICRNGVEFYLELRDCWNCFKKTKIYAYSIEKQIWNVFNFKSEFYIPAQGPESILDIDEWMLKNIDNIKVKYSKTQDRYYIANVCENCDALQGEWFLFHEPESPFWNLNEKQPNFIKAIIF